MILVFVFATLALTVVAFLLWPLLHPGRAGRRHEKHDMIVYREQLAEVDNDIERGLLTKAQAEAARAEIHRRMLAVEDAELSGPPGAHRPVGPRARKILAALTAVLLPVMAVALYLWLGSPGLSGKPFAGRVNDPEFALSSSAEDMKAKLEKTPSIGGYKRLAGTLSMMKRHAAAAEAYQKAVGLGANDAVTWSEMGEEVVLANDGAVVPEALGDFYKALKLDHADARARFYIGLGEAQIGNFKKAVSIWKGLQKDSAPDAPWIVMIKEHIEVYAKEGGFDPASIEPSKPSGQSPHGSVSTHPAESMPEWAKDPAQRDAMIKSMVAGLAAKLENNHGDIQGWIKLANAYRVLGQMDKAQEALHKALRFNPQDAELKAFAASFPGDD